MSRAGINLSDFSPSKNSILGGTNSGKEFFPTEPKQENIITTEPKQEEIQKKSKEIIKKNFKYQTMLISTKNLAFLKVIKDLEHIPQATYLNNLLEEHFKNQNFDDELLKMVQNETDRIDKSLKTSK